MNNAKVARQRRPTVMVMDDEPLNIQVMYHTLKRDYEVFGALNISQAFDICSLVKLDLVLLDVDMPDMDGYQVCEALKANPATCDIPVIFVTAHTDPTIKSRALKAGALDLIYKPINATELRDRLKAVLASQASKNSDLHRDVNYSQKH